MYTNCYVVTLWQIPLTILYIDDGGVTTMVVLATSIAGASTSDSPGLNWMLLYSLAVCEGDSLVLTQEWDLTFMSSSRWCVEDIVLVYLL